MKKLLLSVVFATVLCGSVFAFDIADNHTHNSSFWKNSSSISFRPSYAVGIGAEFDVAEHRKFDNNIYAVHIPFSIRTDSYGLLVKPFWYPNNANGAKAAGARVMLSAQVNKDEIDQNSTQAYLAAGFAAQKADMLKSGTLTEQKDFYQLAYEAGATYNFFDMYSFDLTGTIFEYLSGINGVKELSGVMNQQELADLGTLDYVLGLPKGAAGIKIKWHSSVNNSENYISYKYIDFYTQDAVHSLMLQSNLRIGSNVYFNIAYNHLFESGRNRDLYGGGIMVRF